MIVKKWEKLEKKHTNTHKSMVTTKELNTWKREYKCSLKLFPFNRSRKEDQKEGRRKPAVHSGTLELKDGKKTENRERFVSNVCGSIFSKYE